MQECAEATQTAWRVQAGQVDVQVNAPPAEEWLVSLRAERCWAPLLRVSSEQATRPISVRLWRAGELTGRLALPKDVGAPESLTLRLESAPANRASHAVAPITIQCPVSSGRFRCDVPAAVLDLRISTDGLAPRYRWGVAVPPDATADLGEIRLERGGSIVGYVQFAGDGPPLTEVAVNLVPTLPAPSSVTGRTDEKLTTARAEEVRPNSRGFFQFAHLQPGAYTVTARHAGWSMARLAEIRVEEGRETVLSKPLVFEPLARVEVFVQPMLDPYGKPWTVKLSPMAPADIAAVVVAKGPASMFGVWTADGVHAGAHLVRVDDHRGNSFARTVVDVSPRMGPVQVTIASIAIAGTLEIGGEPLRARLRFHHARAGVVHLRSDGEGRFTGALPIAGKWEVEVITADNLSVRQNVEIDRRDDGPTEVDLDFPDTRLDVIVVREDGTPVRATIRALNREQRIVATGVSGEDGRFRFLGLEPGSIHLIASEKRLGLASARVAAEVSEGTSAEQTIVLRRQITIQGWVVTPARIPVAGAIIRSIVPHRASVREDVSGLSGQFEIAIPPDAGTLEMVILPPGMAVKMLTIPVQSGMDPNVEIVVGGPSGFLEVEMNHEPPFPWIAGRGKPLTLGFLTHPRNWITPPRDRQRWGLAINIEAGDYTICSSRSGGRCVPVSIQPGAVERVDGRGLLK